MRTPTATRPVARPGGEVSALSARLAAVTRETHRSAQQAFALDDRLASAEAYADLLRTLRGFYAPAEQALARVPGLAGLTPDIDVPGRRRAHLLDQDLTALGFLGVHRRGPATDPLERCDLGGQPWTLPRALGWLYVLEGSALGGRVLAGETRRRLGDELPVAFFSSATRSDVDGDWRVLQGALDAYGRLRPRSDSEECLDAAMQCFILLGDWLTRKLVSA